MGKLDIPHDALIFVGDGRKALFLRNEGDEKFLNLKTEQVFNDVNPLTHDQGADRPGSTHSRAEGTRRSSVAQTDWHHLEEHRFVEHVVAALENIVRGRNVPAIVIAAPARALADLRRALHADVQKRVLAEFSKDLTHLPVAEIEKHLVG